MNISHKNKMVAPLGLVLLVVLGCTIDKSGDEGADSTAATTGGGDSSTVDPTATGGTGSTAGEPTSTGSTSTGSTSTGSTGTSGDDTGTGEGNAPCIDTPTVLAIDQQSIGGFSGEQLLAGKLGVRMTMLQFGDEPTSLAEAWKGKTLALTVALRHEGGEVRWIDSEPDPEYQNPGTEGGPGVDCTDRLEVDVELDFVSEGKEFDEHPGAVLTATAVELAELQAQVLPPGLQGSLDLTTIYAPGDPATTITSMWIFGRWVGDQAGGSVMHEINVGGDEGFAGFGPLADWGDGLGL